MPKLRRDPINAETIDGFLLTEDDFGFELSCLRLLGDLGVQIQHGGTYSDPVTNANRQFDLRVHLSLNGHDISLAVECKNLKPYFPLVVSRVPRRDSEAFHEVLFPPLSAGAGRAAMSIDDFCYPHRYTGAQSVYKCGELVGKSTTQIGIRESVEELISDDSDAHGKWAQAVASAYALINEAASRLTAPNSALFGSFIAPVLVVPNGTLWAADYTAEGQKPSPSAQLDDVELYLNHSPWKAAQRFRYTFSHLHFVTQVGLSSYIERIRGDRNYNMRLFGASP